MFMQVTDADVAIKLQRYSSCLQQQMRGQNFPLDIDIPLFLDLLLYYLSPSLMSQWSPI
jgi:hypothetical protein